MGVRQPLEEKETVQGKQQGPERQEEINTFKKLRKDPCSQEKVP